MAFELPGRIGGLTDDERLCFLAEPWNGRLATATAGGWPFIAPVREGPAFAVSAMTWVSSEERER